MQAPFHIVGCLLSNKPAAELVDLFVAQVRRERGAVLTRNAQGASFVRFNAPDTRLVALACETLRGGARLRFGFAVAVRAGDTADPGTLDLDTATVVLANDLAAGAAPGEVLVSMPLALSLLDAGYGFRARKLQLAGGRTLAACALDTVPAPRATVKPRVAPVGPAETAEAAALDGVFQALAAQAEDMLRRQSELEARQDAVLAKLTLFDESQPTTQHLAALQAQLDAQLVRLQPQLDLGDRIEQRIAQMQAAVAAAEQQLAEQGRRQAELQELRAFCERLLGDMAQAQAKLEDVAALQQRLLPLVEQVTGAEAQAGQAQQRAASLASQLAELEGSRALIDEVQGRTSAIAHQLADLQLRLDHLSGQRAAIDEAGEQLARLDFIVQEAHNTLRALRTEREVAERVEQGIQRLRGRSAGRQAG